MVIILGATAYYVYSIITMLEVSISDLLPKISHDPPKSEVKQQKLIKCFLMENGKQYLGKAYTEEQVNMLSAKEVDRLFSLYEAKLSGQMMKSNIGMIAMGAYASSGISNQDVVSEDLEPDPFLNSALQRFPYA